MTTTLLFTTLTLAIRQMIRHRVRTALTTLGVLIGVAAVIAMVSIGQGATRAVDDDLASIGQNLLFVVPGRENSAAPPFAMADATALAELPGVRRTAPVGSRRVVVSAREESWTTTVYGSTLAFLDVMGWNVQLGRAFDGNEERSGVTVCLVGDTIVEEVYHGASPLDTTLRLGDFGCRVIGTLEPKGANTFGQDQDDFVLLPMATFQRRVQGNRDVNVIFVGAADGTNTTELKERVEAMMAERRHLREGSAPDFVVRDMAELVSIVDDVSSVLTSFLASVAAVSLLVGGIGIMNIMLVSVAERTREIGIRLAVGATSRDVLLQFLMEAVVLSAVGGLLGIFLGLGISWVAARTLEVPWIVDPGVIGMAFVVSAVIGVVFGYVPAHRAAHLRPIDALRHE